MTFEQFIDKLMEEIQDFSSEDRSQIREYFEEMFYDRKETGEREEEILRSFGAPETAAARLRSEYESKSETEKTPAERERNFAAVGGQGENRPIDTLLVHSENVPILLRKEKIDRPVLEFEPREGMDVVSVTEENGRLTIWHRYNRSPGFWLRGLFSDLFRSEPQKNLIVHIPENFCGNLELESRNTPMELEGFPLLQSLRLETSNAKLVLRDVQASAIRLKTSNSPVQLQRVSAGNLEARTSNAGITANQAAAGQELRLSTSNSSISVEHLSGKNITLHTSNGSVRGSIAGSIVDYNVKSGTSNGRSTLPTSMNLGKDKNLEVTTSNGNIELHFENDG